MNAERAAHLTLRVGAAFAFAYPAVREIFDPISWLGYLPAFVRELPAQAGFPVDSLVLLHLFGTLEVILAVWILLARSARVPAVLMTLLLLAIVLFNWGDLDILFRDLSIAALTLALVLWPRVNGPSAQQL